MPFCLNHNSLSLFPLCTSQALPQAHSCRLISTSPLQGNLPLPAVPASQSLSSNATRVTALQAFIYRACSPVDRLPPVGTSTQQSPVHGGHWGNTCKAPWPPAYAQAPGWTRAKTAVLFCHRPLWACPESPAQDLLLTHAVGMHKRSLEKQSLTHNLALGPATGLGQ